MKLPVPEAARHVFYDLRPGWTAETRPGDIVVAGRNFGIGSSRPVAALMRHLGVAALVAEEFNSLFLRNAINNGLPALTVPRVRDLVREGDEITIHLAEGWLAAGNRRIQAAPLPRMVLDILDAGGLLPRVRTIRSTVRFTYSAPPALAWSRRRASSNRLTTAGSWRTWAGAGRGRPTRWRSTSAGCSAW